MYAMTDYPDVDGGSQICERCGGSMFRTAVRHYSQTLINLVS